MKTSFDLSIKSIEFKLKNFDNNSIFKKEDIKNSVYENINESKNVSKLNDNELNSMVYKEALKIDKRTYIQYYCSLLRVKHILILLFYTNDDYNSKIIKISLFLFNFTLYYIINSLFFDDSMMHKIYEDKGAFNFIYNLPKIL